ncbi:MAG TPA: DUF2252 domain-containing protein [Marmoricola sp.]|nr:DUF2252 domain-containing protein [Marmoricola sp.]
MAKSGSTRTTGARVTVPEPRASRKGSSRTTATDGGARPAPPPSLDERVQRGREARRQLPPEQIGQVDLSDRADPVDILQRQGAKRLPELVPVRYGRMLATPFAFLRGAAAVMAADLATAPVSGLVVQACGDAHLANFGAYAAPDRRLVFDLNDFDETHPGPWEWDLLRLAASFEMAGRERGLSRKERKRAVRAVAARYREAMAAFAGQGNLAVWYARIDVEDIRTLMADKVSAQRRKAFDKSIAKARSRNSLRALGKLTELVDGHRRFHTDPPLLVPISDLLPDLARDELQDRLRGLLAGYRSTLQRDRRALLIGYEYVDLARKVVGVGSVGTRCWVTLLRGRDDDDPLVLQIKEAERSVLAPHVPAPMLAALPPELQAPDHQGERVVAGQHLMQAASDVFLGWERTAGIDGVERDFYVRQLHDQKGSADVEGMNAEGLVLYAQMCAWTLARAHARSGDRVAIAADLGAVGGSGDGRPYGPLHDEDDGFVDAVVRFAVDYADRTEQDHDLLARAAQSGRVPVETGL